MQNKETCVFFPFSPGVGGQFKSILREAFGGFIPPVTAIPPFILLPRRTLARVDNNTLPLWRAAKYSASVGARCQREVTGPDRYSSVAGFRERAESPKHL